MSFIFSLQAFWNNANTTFTGIGMDISNGLGNPPVANIASRALNLLNNGVSVASVDINGNIYGYTRNAIGASSRALQNKDNDIVSLLDFNPIAGTGGDDTTAINNFLTYISENSKAGLIPNGTYNFSANLAPAVGTSDWTLYGESRYGVNLHYIGGSTTIDLFKVSNCILFDMFNFRISSDITMTAGQAIRYSSCSYYLLDGIILDGNLLGNKKLYNGFWADASQWGMYINGNVYCSNDGITATSAVELSLDNMQLINIGGNAIHLGGGFGGLYTGYISVFGANVGLRVDTAITGTANDQIFCDNRTVFDNCKISSIYLNDPILSSKTFAFKGWCASALSAGGSSFVVANWQVGKINMAGAQIIANKGNGIAVLDSSSYITIDASTIIADNSNFGITQGGVVRPNLSCMALMYNNTGGNTDMPLSAAVQGNFGVGTRIFGTNANFVLGLHESTPPSTSPAAVGQLYIEAGALKYRGVVGTITSIAAS